MEIVTNNLFLTEYLGQNSLKVDNLPNILNVEKIVTLANNGISELEATESANVVHNQAGCMILSKTVPYILEAEVNLVPTNKVLGIGLQIAKWMCEDKLISDMHAEFFNGVQKVAKINENNSYVTWEKGTPDFLQTLTSFVSGETYMFLNEKPYTLY